MSIRIGIKSVGIQGWKTLWQSRLVTQAEGNAYVEEPVGEPTLDPEAARRAAEAERDTRLAPLQQAA